jgi:hypothetical protein
MKPETLVASYARDRDDRSTGEKRLLEPASIQTETAAFSYSRTTYRRCGYR